MPRAELVNGRIALETEYRDRDLVRAVPGAKFDAAARSWSAPLSWGTCKALRGIFGERLELGSELEKWAWNELETRVGPALAAREAALSPENDTDGDPRLYPYQRTGVAFLAVAGSAILADEMGTGKTAQTIATLERLGAYPALIVAPNSVKRSWLREFDKWAPHRDVRVVSGSAAKRRKALEPGADVYVIHWDVLRHHSRLAPYGNIRLTDEEKTPKELNRAWRAVVADEAHRGKDPKSKQTRALWAASADADHRFALTGTPIANHPGDFWSLLRFVAPDEWPSKSRFIDRYCLTTWNPHGGIDIVGIRPELRDEFYSVVDPRFLRRPKDLVLSWLPPKVRITRTVEMVPKQRKAYHEMRKGMLAEVDSGVVMGLDPLTKLARLQQFANAYAEVDEDGKVTLSEPSGKLDSFMEFLADVGTDEPVVAYAASKQLINLAAARLEKAGIAYGRVTGDESEDVRDFHVRNFQAGQTRVLLCTLAAASEGITLTRARYLCFLQRSWSLVENRQAEDRIHRPGAEQHERVFIIDFITEETVEENLLGALEAKDGRLEEIARDKETIERMLSL